MPSSESHLTTGPAARPTIRGVCFVAAVVAILVAAVELEGADAVAAAAFIAVLAVISAVDIEERRVPNRIVLPSAAVALVWQAAFHRDDLWDCLIAGLGAGLFFGIAALLTRGGIGMGDAKLALLIGVVLGREVVTALFVATLAGAIAAGLLLAFGGRDARRRPIPYAPFLAGGAVIALLFATGSPLHP